MLYKNDINFCSKFKLADKLSIKQKELIIVYKKNLFYAQKF